MTEAGATIVRFAVLEATERLDRFLAEQLSLSRTQAARLVAEGHVLIGGVPARASRSLEPHEEVEVHLPAVAPPRHLAATDIPLTVVFEDADLIVIDKPAGLVVHPAPGHWDDTVINALLHRGTRLEGGVEGRPGLVHRLDRDTSGLMVIAKSDLAHRRLGAAIAARRVKRVYAALAWGHLDQSSLTIEASLARHPRDRKRMTVSDRGRAARTDAWVAARFAVCDLLRLELHTGRTHQIRVHLEHIGHPVVGDPVYGGGGARRITAGARALADRIERATPRQALHAAELSFRHPIDGHPLVFRAEWPADLFSALRLAAGQDSVAPDSPLAYLRFYQRDG